MLGEVCDVRNAVVAYQLAELNSPESFSDLNIQYEGNVECTIEELYSDGSFYLDGCKVNKSEKEYSLYRYSEINMPNQDKAIELFFDRKGNFEVNWIGTYNQNGNVINTGCTGLNNLLKVLQVYTRYLPKKSASADELEKAYS